MLGESNSVSGYVGIQKSFMHWFCNYKWLHVCWVSYCSFVREGNFNFNNIRRPKSNWLVASSWYDVFCCRLDEEMKVKQMRKELVPRAHLMLDCA